MFGKEENDNDNDDDDGLAWSLYVERHISGVIGTTIVWGD